MGSMALVEVQKVPESFDHQLVLRAYVSSAKVPQVPQQLRPGLHGGASLRKGSLRSHVSGAWQCDPSSHFQSSNFCVISLGSSFAIRAHSLALVH